MLSLAPLLSKLTIKTKELGSQKLDLHYRHPEYGDFGWAQRQFIAEIERQYNHGKPVRCIVLKARQLGISTAMEGTMFWWNFIHPGTNGLVMTHEKDQTEELFQMTKNYWDTWPYKDAYKLKYATRTQLRWQNGSQLRVATAQNVRTGRGSTLNAVHMSEAAFYPDPETLMTGLDESVPHRHGSIVVIESTANGIGNWFYDIWNSSKDRQSDFIPLFFPWYKHPEYQQPTTLTIKSELDAEERQLLLLGASMENIAWRRWKIRQKNGDLLGFMQEYPSTDEEAFIVTGRTIFSTLLLKRIYEPEHGRQGIFYTTASGEVRWMDTPDGPWFVFRRPNRRNKRTDQYFVASDSSNSVEGDPSCIQVINRENFEQVAVYHSRSHPADLGDEVMMAGKFYNNCMVAPEIEGGGQTTINTIIMKNYPNIYTHKRADSVSSGNKTMGWSTNYTRRYWMVGRLREHIAGESMILHDRITYVQFRQYVQREDGTWGSPSRGTQSDNFEDHDDAVMAFGIAVAASIAEGPFQYDAPRSSVLDELIRQEFEAAQAVPA